MRIQLLKKNFYPKNKLLQMNFYNFRFSLIALCFMLFPLTLFAQTDDTETPDTSWFTDVTAQSGLTLSNANFAIAVDVNNDDYPDILVVSNLGVDNGFTLYINEERPGSSDPTDRIFVDETATSGLNVPGVYKDLASIGDFDNDGNVDIIVNCWYLNNETSCPTIPDPAKNRLRIFWGNGDGTFTLDSLSNTPNSGLENLGILPGSGLPSLDYDRDGYLDFFVACHYNNWCQQVPQKAHLMHNNGDRTFTDVTTQAGINVSEKDSSKPWLFKTWPTARALFGANVFDWNNDCWPDIFTCPYEATGYPYETNGPDTADTRGYGNLYRNNGNGTFTDVGITENWDPHFAWSVQGIVPWAAMPGDYNNDGNMDFLAVLVHGENYDTVPPYNEPNAFPGDGRTAIFTNLGPDSNYRFKPDVGRIHRNNPQNITHGDHNGFWIDMNNDGYQDIVLGDAAYDETQYGDSDMQRMFFELQDTLNHDFNDITHRLGYIKNDTEYASSILHKIRRPGEILPVDYDLDGDDDILKYPYGAAPPNNDSVTLFRNNVGNKNNHITIKLIAPDGVNKSCIGARITVVSGNLRQMKEIYGDQGQWTVQYPFIQNFGLGKRTMVDTIDVRWPDADCTHTILTNVAANQFVRISDSTTSIMPVGANTPNNFTLYPNPDAGSHLYVKFQGPINPLIEIYNDLGQQVLDYQPGYASSFTLPLGNIPAGVYFVHIIGGPNGTVLTKSFVKTTNP
jgi:enediyne biosynthesis protein E4